MAFNGYHLSSYLEGYKRSEVTIDTLKEKIGIAAYELLRRNVELTEDEVSEIFTVFYPMLDKLIKNYSEQGNSFEAYVYTSLKYRIRTFRRLQYVKNKKKKVIADIHNRSLKQKINIYKWKMEQEEQLEKTEKDSLLEYFHILTHHVLGLDKPENRKKRFLRRRLLLFGLKNTRHLTQEHVDYLEKYTEIQRNVLLHWIESLSKRIESNVVRYQMLTLRISKLYTRLYVNRYYSDIEAEDERERISAKLKKSISFSQERRRGVRVFPSNADISSVVGIPKGTVDSSLYYMKQTLQVLQKTKKINLDR
ncbi:MAG: hypothetical protein ACLFR1_12480 [Spirochaetia bacterium]